MAPTWRGAALLPLLLMSIFASIYAGPVPVRRPRYVITDGGRDNVRPPVEVSANSSGLTVVCNYENNTYVKGNEIETQNKCESCYCGPEGSMVCVPRCRQMMEPMSSGECYKDNKTYSNGQKIQVDPSSSGSASDPCKVCYCVKGEVVCSPLACYQRDDCEPRFVPGRCCPEYDHCPLKDTTDVEESSKSKVVFDISADEKFKSKESHTKDQSSTLAEAKGEPKKVITIKEVTPVSEIPSMGGIKIKEILPPTIDLDYDSTKAPLTQRQVPFTQPASEKTTQTTIQPETTTQNITTTTAPPVIKIGDATVITVIGAEGLERGGEEEDVIDTKFYPEKTDKANTTHSQGTKNDDEIAATSNIVLQHSDLSDELAEVVRELQASTTITLHTLSNSSPSTNAPYIAESDIIGKDSQHEHLNEEDRDHNIEFPPIPDDITIHHQDESIDVSETPALDHMKVESSSDDAKVTVNHKRPVFSLSSYQEVKNKNKIYDINPGKTLINLHANKNNDSDIVNDNTNVMSADWLKSSVEISTDENTLPDTSIESSVKDSPLLNLNSELPQDILNENSSIEDTDFEHGEITTIRGEFLQTENMLDDDPTTIFSTTASSLGESTEFDIGSSMLKSIGVSKDEITTSTSVANDDLSSACQDKTVPVELFTTTTISKDSIENSSPKTINGGGSTTDSEKTIVSMKDDNMPKKDTADVLVELEQPEFASKEKFPTNEKSQTFQRNIDGVGDDLISLTLTSFNESDHKPEKNISDELTETNEFLTVKPNKDRTNVISDLINLVGDVVSIGDTLESAKESSGQNAKLISGGHLYSGEVPLVSNTVEHESKENEKSATSSPSDTVLSNNDISVESQQEASDLKNKNLELNDELDIHTENDTTEGNENIEHTTKSVIIDHLTDSDMNDMNSMKHKDIELLSNITLNKNTGPTKVIKQDDDEPRTQVEPETTSAENASTTTSITEGTITENNDYNKQQNIYNENITASTDASFTDSIATD